MPRYRVFEIDENGHRSDGPIVVLARDDIEALVCALDLTHSAGMEIFNDQDERVGLIERRSKE